MKGEKYCPFCERKWIIHTKEEKETCQKVIKYMENTRATNR